MIAAGIAAWRAGGMAEVRPRPRRRPAAAMR